MFHGIPHVNVNGTAVVICLAVTLYYWWENIKGIEESTKVTVVADRVSSDVAA